MHLLRSSGRSVRAAIVLSVAALVLVASAALANGGGPTVLEADTIVVSVKEAIPKGLLALTQLMESESKQARDALAHVSLFGGLALANSGLGVIHGIAGPLGGLSGAPHGAICGALLPAGIAANRDKVVDADQKARIEDVIGWIAGVFETSPDQALNCLREWIIQKGLPGLASIGVTEEHMVAASQSAASSSSMKANPVELPAATIENIMRQSF